MISFTLASYNSRINSLLHTLPFCVWLLFLLCFLLCSPSTISSNMFWICVVVYIWDNHTWNQQYLLYLKSICLDAVPNFGTWHIKLNRKNASLGKMDSTHDVIVRVECVDSTLVELGSLFYYLWNTTIKETESRLLVVLARFYFFMRMRKFEKEY